MSVCVCLSVSVCVCIYACMYTLSTCYHMVHFIGIVDGLVCPSRKQSDPPSASPIPVKRVSYTFCHLFVIFVKYVVCVCVCVGGGGR